MDTNTELRIQAVVKTLIVIMLFLFFIVFGMLADTLFGSTV